MKLRIRRIDQALRDFLAALEWPDGVPTPDVDVAVDEAGKVMLRFVGVALAPASAPADFSSPGASPFELVYALSVLAAAWCKRHGAEPGVYPQGIRAQIVHRLDLRQAAQWLYSVQLAGALATNEPTL